MKPNHSARQDRALLTLMALGWMPSSGCIVDPCALRFDRGEEVWPDVDGDGYPSRSTKVGDEWYFGGVDIEPRWSCEAGDGYIPRRADDYWDCDDNDPTVNPAAVEICGDGVYSTCRQVDSVEGCPLAYVGCYDEAGSFPLGSALDYVQDGGTVRVCGDHDGNQRVGLFGTKSVAIEGESHASLRGDSFQHRRRFIGQL
jgi:hypothetical protein